MELKWQYGGNFFMLKKKFPKIEFPNKQKKIRIQIEK
jgi:hypothetical protein